MLVQKLNKARIDLRNASENGHIRMDRVYYRARASILI